MQTCRMKGARKMERKTDIRSIFINLPIKEIARTRAFWTKLGFSFNEEFSDEKHYALY